MVSGWWQGPDSWLLAVITNTGKGPKSMGPWVHCRESKVLTPAPH